MTLLEIIREVCSRSGLLRPAVIMSSQDDMLLQMAALLNEVHTDLRTRLRWQALFAEASWSAVAAENQGALETLAPGLQLLVPETFFNRTAGLRYTPCLSPQEWADMRAMGLTPSYRFRIVAGTLRVFPTPAAGDSMAFEYRSSYAVRDSLGVPKAYFTQDSDTSVFLPELLVLGLRWRWKAEKGFAYAEEMAAYERAVAEHGNLDAGGRSIAMDNCTQTGQPGIVIPVGNWSP